MVVMTQAWWWGGDDISVVVVVMAREKAAILNTVYLERLLIEMRVNVTTVCCTIR